MKLIKLTKNGLSSMVARRIYSKKFDHYFYAIAHGEVGDKTCWQIRIPIPRSEIVPNSVELDTTGMNFKLVNINKRDARGQETYMLERGKEDASHLVFVEADATDTVFISGAIEMLPSVGTGFSSKYQMFLIRGISSIKVKKIGRVNTEEPVEFGLLCDGGIIKSKRRFVYDEEEVVC